MRVLTCEETAIVAGGADAVQAGAAAGTSMALLGLGLRLGAVAVGGAAAMPIAGGVAIGAAVISAGIALYWAARRPYH